MPLLVGDAAAEIRRRKDGRGVDDDVRAAESADPSADRADARAVRDVDHAGDESGPPICAISCRPAAAASLRSATTRWAPSAAAFSAAARPIPLPAPTITQTRRLSSLGGGIRWSFASSSAQYSMLKASRPGSAT